MPIHPDSRSRYPSNWEALSRRIRFVRASGRCECTGQCGHDHGGRCEALHDVHHPVTGSRVVLTVAHLDHMPEHNDESNLLAMCQRCHLAYDRVEHAESRRRRRDVERGQHSLFDGGER